MYFESSCSLVSSVQTGQELWKWSYEIGQTKDWRKDLEHRVPPSLTIHHGLIMKKGRSSETGQPVFAIICHYQIYLMLCTHS